MIFYLIISETKTEIILGVNQELILKRKEERKARVTFENDVSRIVFYRVGFTVRSSVANLCNNKLTCFKVGRRTRGDQSNESKTTDL